MIFNKILKSDKIMSAGQPSLNQKTRDRGVLNTSLFDIFLCNIWLDIMVLLMNLLALNVCF